MSDDTLAALLTSTRAQQDVAGRLGTLESRVGGLEVVMGSVQAECKRTADTLERMDTRADEDLKWRRKRELAVWQIVKSPLAYILAAAAIWFGLRFGVVPSQATGQAAASAAPGGQAAPLTPGEF